MDRKLKILFNNEFSELHTGFSTLGKELMTRMYATGKYELAEHARYVHNGDPRIQKVPWKVYPVMPHPQDQKGQEVYRANYQQNQFGAHTFNSVLFDFEPDLVIDLTDAWMCEYVAKSPYRKLFKWMWLHPTDSEDHHPKWLELLSEPDYLFSYSNFGKRTLEKESGGKLKVLDVLGGGIDPNVFSPPDKKTKNALREKYGIPKDYTVFMMVSRNQKRKLFSQLIRAYKTFRNKYPQQAAKTILLLFTSHKDVGADLPLEVSRCGLHRNVLFAYHCMKCGHNIISPFLGFVDKNYNDQTDCGTCPRCGEISCRMPNTQVGMEKEDLAGIYKLVDFYVHYSVSEGLSLPCVFPEEYIVTSNGSKMIKDVKIGDKVQTHTGKYKKVTQTFKNPIYNQMKKITCYGNTNEVKITENHRMYCVRKNKIKDLKDVDSIKSVLPEWIPAGSIQEGDYLLTPIDPIRHKNKTSYFRFCSNKYLYSRVKKVENYDYDGPVYNLEVEDDNSYVVNSYIVHNCLEAKACGKPVAAVDYTALEDHAHSGGGVPIKVATKYIEHESMYSRAIPDNNDLVKIFRAFCRMKPDRYKAMSAAARKEALNWSFDKRAKEFMDYIDNKFEYCDRTKTWDAVQFKCGDLDKEDFELPNKEFVKACYEKVCGMEPDNLHYNRFCMELDNGIKTREDIYGYFKNSLSKNIVQLEERRQSLKAFKALPEDQKKKLKEAQPKLDPEDKFRILYVMPESAGDVLMSTAVVDGIKNKYPDASIYFSTKDPFVSILQGNPNIKGIVSYDERMLNYRSLEGFAGEKGHFDISFCPYIVTQKIPHWIHNGHGTHLVETYANMCNVDVGKPFIKIVEPSLEVKDLLPKEYITIHTTGGQNGLKDYDYFQKVVDKLSIPVVQIGGSEDKKLENIVDLRGKTTFNQTAWVIKNAKMHLGVDSFPAHLAGVVGTPSVILFGATWSNLCKPYWGNNIILEPKNRGRCFKPCHLTECPFGSEKCINLIPPKEVLKAVGNIIGKENVFFVKRKKKSAGEKLNILSFNNHERIQSLIARTGHNFYHLPSPERDKWHESEEPIPENIIMIDKIPEDVDFDLVISHSRFGQYPVAQKIAQKLDIPHIWLEHTTPLKQWLDMSQYLDSLVESNMANTKLFISKDSQKKWHFDDTNSIVIEHGVDTEFFSGYIGGNVVLNVVKDWKNRGEILGYDKWFEIVGDLPYKILGNNPDLSERTKSREELLKAYQTAGVFLNTTVYSPIPCVVLEAMSVGVPVVSTATCAIPEYIEDGVNGFISNDTEYLKEKVHWCLEHPEEAKAIGQKARQTILDKCNLDRYVKKWEEIIRSTVEEFEGW